MIKVKILSTCEFCDGDAYLPIGEAESNLDEKYLQYEPCSQCQGSSKQDKWISLIEFADLVERATSLEPDYEELANHEPAAANRPGLPPSIETGAHDC